MMRKTGRLGVPVVVEGRFVFQNASGLMATGSTRPNHFRGHQASFASPLGAARLSNAKVVLGNHEVPQPPFGEIFDLLIETVGYCSVYDTLTQFGSSSGLD